MQIYKSSNNPLVKDNVLKCTNLKKEQMELKNQLIELAKNKWQLVPYCATFKETIINP